MNITHFGRSGSGKSYTAKREAERSRRPFVAVWDANGEWAGQRSKDAPRGRRIVVRNLDEFLRLQSTRSKPLAPLIAFQLDGDKFGRWCQWVRSCGNLLAIVDEAQLVAPPSGLLPQTKRLFTTCRHGDIDLVLCCQRPATLHPDARSQAQLVRCWRMTEPLDLRYIEQLGGNPRAIKALAPRKFLEWQP